MATFAPALAMRRAVSAPMPRAAPEIKATLPSRRFIAVTSGQRMPERMRQPLTLPARRAGSLPLPAPARAGRGPFLPPRPSCGERGGVRGFVDRPGLLFLIGNRGFELFEPDPRGGVGGGAPIAARGQGTARRDLRAFGQRRPLELAELEEAVQKNPQPLLDFGKIVGALCCIGDVGRPAAAFRVAPGIP